MPVDLSTCKPGDKLLSKHGIILTYVGPTPEGHYYDHEVTYPCGSRGTRMNDGRVFKNRSLPEDHDIVKILRERLTSTECVPDCTCVRRDMSAHGRLLWQR